MWQRRPEVDRAISWGQFMRSVWNRGWEDGESALLAVGTLLVAVAVSVNTPWNGFVYDDLQNIVQNHWIKNPGSILEIFGSHVGGFNPEFATSYYRPLIHVAHMIVYQVAGLSPAAFHLFNVLLHAVYSVLVFLISRELIRRGPSASRYDGLSAFAVGLLFATHPVHSESIAWISGSATCRTRRSRWGHSFCISEGLEVARSTTGHQVHCSSRRACAKSRPLVCCR
jgi:hypothetical protein